MISIDVVIPSYRLQSKYLLPILQMDVPLETTVRFLLIADNPEAEIPKDIELLIDNQKILLFRNPENLGVCKTRNIGIDNATADWILFLDDDVIPSKHLLTTYVHAIKGNPNEIGFYGDVVFPPAINSFTNGIRASGMLGLFSVPNHTSLRKWVPTANVLVNRSAIGTIRFKEIFAKAGAGEEIDFFLQIFKKTNGSLNGLANAQAYHDWWYEGRRIYTRFIRWNTGFAILPGIFPEYSYYTFPNILESLLLGIPLNIVACFYFHSILLLLCILPGVIAGECIVEFLHLLKTKGFSKSIFVIEVVLIRAAGDLGRLLHQFKKGEIFTGVCRRFNFSCNRKTIAAQRFWAGLKFITYFLLSISLYSIFR